MKKWVGHHFMVPDPLSYTTSFSSLENNFVYFFIIIWIDILFFESF